MGLLQKLTARRHHPADDKGLLPLTACNFPAHKFPAH